MIKFLNKKQNLNIINYGLFIIVDTLCENKCTILNGILHFDKVGYQNIQMCFFYDYSAMVFKYLGSIRKSPEEIIFIKDSEPK